MELNFLGGGMIQTHLLNLLLKTKQNPNLNIYILNLYNILLN